jgi:hypothetical protein
MGHRDYTLFRSFGLLDKYSGGKSFDSHALPHPQTTLDEVALYQHQSGFVASGHLRIPHMLVHSHGLTDAGDARFEQRTRGCGAKTEHMYPLTAGLRARLRRVGTCLLSQLDNSDVTLLMGRFSWTEGV